MSRRNEARGVPPDEFGSLDQIVEDAKAVGLGLQRSRDLSTRDLQKTIGLDVIPIMVAYFDEMADWLEEVEERLDGVESNPTADSPMPLADLMAAIVKVCELALTGSPLSEEDEKSVGELKAVAEGFLKSGEEEEGEEEEGEAAEEASKEDKKDA